MRAQIASLFVLIASIATAAEPDFAKSELLIDHPAATIKEDNLTCRSENDYTRMMTLLRDDQEAAKSYVMGKVRSGACITIKKGTQIIVEDSSALKPMRFHVKGKPMQLWIYGEAIEPSSKSKE